MKPKVKSSSRYIRVHKEFYDWLQTFKAEISYLGWDAVHVSDPEATLALCRKIKTKGFNK